MKLAVSRCAAGTTCCGAMDEIGATGVKEGADGLWPVACGSLLPQAARPRASGTAAAVAMAARSFMMRIPPQVMQTVDLMVWTAWGGRGLQLVAGQLSPRFTEAR